MCVHVTLGRLALACLLVVHLSIEESGREVTHSGIYRGARVVVFLILFSTVSVSFFELKKTASQCHTVLYRAV